MYPELLRRIEALENALERRNSIYREAVAWNNYTPTITGSGGVIGTFAANPYLGQYCILGHLCFVVNDIKITNLGSWSGTILVALPVIPSASLLDNTPGFGWLAADASNPATASKGFPNLTHSDSNYRFVLTIDAAYATFADIAINYHIRTNFVYEVG